MYSTGDYIKAILLIILIVIILAGSIWAFTVGPCAVSISEMPGWCLLLLSKGGR